MRRLGAAILLACLAAMLAACSRQNAPPPPAHLTVTVLSFNIRWDGFDDGKNNWELRRERVYDVIRSTEPDVVGLQESSPKQVADLLGALPRYAAYNAGERSDVVTILYRSDRFRLDRSGGLWLVKASDLSGGTRRCTWVRLVSMETGLAFRHFNLHLDHRSLPSREQSVVVLSRHLAELDPPDPFVVTGDFNTGENSPPMKYLRGENDKLPENPVPLVDTFRVLHPDEKNVSTASGFSGRRRGSKIDYVLVRPGTRVLSARIIREERDGRYPSDHFPVSARLEF